VKFNTGETFTKICRDLFKIGQRYLTPHEDICMFILFSIEWGKKLSVKVRNFGHFRVSRETRALASSCLSADISLCLSPCLSADLSACLSSCMEANPTGWIFMKVDVGDFYDNLSRDCIVH
jgi:hypothetical protein